MGRIRIEMQYDSIEERDELEIQMMASKCYNALTDINNKFREYIKYGKGNLQTKDYLLIEKMRDEFYRILEENDVNLLY